MRFSVFVREHHESSATVHALEAPHVFAYGGSPETTVAWIKRLAEFVVFARTYVEGSEHTARDTRTDTHATGAVSILEDGRIDEFLLANLRSLPSRPAKKPEKPRGLRTPGSAL